MNTYIYICDPELDQNFFQFVWVTKGAPEISTPIANRAIILKAQLACTTKLQ